MALLFQGLVVTSLDIDDAEQRFARLNVAYERLCERVRFLQADAICLPFGDARFGTVVSVNALHHFPDWRPLLGELLRVVDPHGILLLADFKHIDLGLLQRGYRFQLLTHLAKFLRRRHRKGLSFRV